MENLAIVVPLKGFDVAKSRLRDGSVADVGDVARRLARGVLHAARPRPLFVACESPDVELFALDQGAQVISSRAANLNEAVSHAYRALSPSYAHIVVAHGDLRDPHGLGTYTPREGVTVFTDDRGTGTNVLVVPTGHDFVFQFGHDSAHAHEREARRLHLEVFVNRRSAWRFDVDVPSDLAAE